MVNWMGSSFPKGGHTDTLHYSQYIQNKKQTYHTLSSENINYFIPSACVFAQARVRNAFVAFEKSK